MRLHRCAEGKKGERERLVHYRLFFASAPTGGVNCQLDAAVFYADGRSGRRKLESSEFLESGLGKIDFSPGSSGEKLIRGLTFWEYTYPVVCYFGKKLVVIGIYGFMQSVFL